MRWLRLTVVFILAGTFGATVASALPAVEPFVRVSPRDSRYFEFSDGRPFVSIGLNLIAPPVASEAEGLARMDEWMQQLAANGGNFSASG